MKTTAQRRAGSQPVTKRGIELSRRHLQQSMNFNQKLALEHSRAAAYGDKAYNKDHAKSHAKAVKQDAKELKDLAKQIKKKGY